MAKRNNPSIIEPSDFDLEAQLTQEPIADIEGQGAYPEKHVFRSQEKVETMTFKLKVASCRKDLGFKGNAIPVQAEHCHFYHTKDSNGVAQTRSNAIAGHFHVITVEELPTGKKIVKCSSAKKEEKKFNPNSKRYEKVIVDVYEAGQIDPHTHSMEYIGTNIIDRRTMNKEAAILVSTEIAKGTPPPGIIG